MGTELMVRKLLADRLFLTKEEEEPKDKKQLITWLMGMTIVIRLVVDKSIQAKQPKGLVIREGKATKHLNKHGDVQTKKSKGHAYRVEINLIDIPHKKDKNDKLNAMILLVNNNGAYTKWHMSDASNWFRRAMPKVFFQAVIEVLDGENLVSKWSIGRKRKVDKDFFYVSASKMIAQSKELIDKADKMEKYNLLRASMYRQWSKNTIAAAEFYDRVRTS